MVIGIVCHAGTLRTPRRDQRNAPTGTKGDFRWSKRAVVPVLHSPQHPSLPLFLPRALLAETTENYCNCVPGWQRLNCTCSWRCTVSIMVALLAGARMPAIY